MLSTTISFGAKSRVSLLPVLFIFWLMIAPMAVAEATEHDCLSTDWPSDRSQLQGDDSLFKGKLDNGFRYVIKENKKPKNRVAIYLDVQAGSLHEEDDQLGYAHYLEHMMFRGSRHFPSGELADFFQSRGMDFGGDANAQTSYGATIYTLMLPDGSRQEVDSALVVMADYAGGALLLEEEIDAERGVILAEKRARDSAEYRSRVAKDAVALQGTRFPLRRVIGTNETLAGANRSQLKSYYEAWYRPENMVLVVVGDIDRIQVDELIVKHFAGLKAVGAAPVCPDFGKLDQTRSNYFYNFDPELGKTRVAIDNYQDLALQNDSLLLEREGLLKTISRMAMNFRLQRLQESGSLPFSKVSYRSGDFMERVRYSSLRAEVDPELWPDALGALEKILRKVILEGLDESDLDRAKREILSHLEASVLTSDSEDSRAIAGNIIYHLNSNRVYQSAEQERRLYSPLVNDISIAEVNSFFRREWEEKKKFVSVTGNARLLGDGREKIAAVYKESTGEKIARREKRRETVFPYLLLPSGDSQPNSAYLNSTDIEQLTFGNGLIVNLKKTDFRKNKVLVRADFGLGKQAETRPGLALLAESTINLSGSGQLLQSKIDELLSGRSMDIGFSAGRSSFSWTGSTLAKDFDFFCRILQTLMFDPGFRENGFTKAKDNIKLMYEGIESEIEGGLPLRIRPFLAGNNFHFGLPQWVDIARLDYPLVSSWVKENLRPEDLEISIVGDFNRPEVVQSLMKYFSGVPLKHPGPVKSVSPVFPEGKNLEVEVKTSVKKSLVSIAWPTGGFVTIGQTRRLQLLADIFEDRLREVIRRQMAASYSPSVSSFTSRVYRGYGYIMANVLVRLGEEKRVTAAIEKISRQMRKQGVSADELSRAKKPLMTSLRETVRNNRYWLHSVLAGVARSPEQVDWSQSILSDNTAVTKREIDALAKKYLSREKAATVTVTPST